MNQTRRYCSGHWREWDSKITTPPGLYVLGVGWARALRAAAALRRRLMSSSSSTSLPPLEEFCTTTTLRSFNVLLSVVCFVAAASVHRGLHFVSWEKKKTKATSSRGTKTIVVEENAQLAARGYPLTLAAAALVSLLPTHAFYSFLFYTDVGALAAVLSSWSFALRRRYWLSAVASLFSLCFRQTSAVWCCFVLGDAALRELTLLQQQDEEGGGAEGRGNGSSDSSSQTLLREAAAVAAALLRNRAAALRSIFRSCFPLSLPIFASFAFVLWNGGSLALGDKDNHSVSGHWAQSLYVSCFAFLTLFPALGDKDDVIAALVELSPVRAVAVEEETEEEGGRRRGGRGARANSRSKGKRVALRPNVQGLRSSLSLFCFAWLAAAHGTVEHPFLLSDNRHYSFYAWRLARKVLGPVGSPARTAATALAGAVSFAWVRRRLVLSSSASSMTNKFPRAWFLGFALAAAASLVPSPLLEFRYFTTAVAVAALAAAAPGRAGASSSSSRALPSSSPSSPSPGQLALALLLYVGVLAAVVRVFLMRPFEQDGELKRFMF